jgi:hypothetical protein
MTEEPSAYVRHLLYVDYLGLCDLTAWTPMTELRWNNLSDDETASELLGLRDLLRKLVNRELYFNWWTGDSGEETGAIQ